MQLSDRLNRLAPSATLAMSQKSAELKAQGIDIINLSVGEPDFNTPDHIKAAGQQAIADNWSRYSPVPGYLDLRQAICTKLERENGLHYEPTQIVVGNGAKQAVCNVLLSVVNPGDEVIIPAPYWVSYPDMVRLADGEPVFVEATIEQNFKITPQQLAAAITPRTKAIILCSPSNPLVRCTVLKNWKVLPKCFANILRCLSLPMRFTSILTMWASMLLSPLCPICKSAPPSSMGCLRLMP